MVSKKEKRIFYSVVNEELLGRHQPAWSTKNYRVGKGHRVQIQIPVQWRIQFKASPIDGCLACSSWLSPPHWIIGSTVQLLLLLEVGGILNMLSCTLDWLKEQVLGKKKFLLVLSAKIAACMQRCYASILFCTKLGVLGVFLVENKISQFWKLTVVGDFHDAIRWLDFYPFSHTQRTTRVYIEPARAKRGSRGHSSSESNILAHMGWMSEEAPEDMKELELT